MPVLVLLVSKRGEDNLMLVEMSACQEKILGNNHQGSIQKHREIQDYTAVLVLVVVR